MRCHISDRTYVTVLLQGFSLTPDSSLRFLHWINYLPAELCGISWDYTPDERLKHPPSLFLLLHLVLCRHWSFAEGEKRKQRRDSKTEPCKTFWRLFNINTRQTEGRAALSVSVRPPGKCSANRGDKYLRQGRGRVVPALIAAPAITLSAPRQRCQLLAWKVSFRGCTVINCQHNMQHKDANVFSGSLTEHEDIKAPKIYQLHPTIIQLCQT